MSNPKVSLNPCRGVPITNINGCFVILDAAQNFETTELPFSAFRCINRSDLETTMYRGCIVVDKLDGPLEVRQQLFSLARATLTYGNSK